jgi:hypothetical protein
MSIALRGPALKTAKKKSSFRHSDSGLPSNGSVRSVALRVVASQENAVLLFRFLAAFSKKKCHGCSKIGKFTLFIINHHAGNSMSTALRGPALQTAKKKRPFVILIPGCRATGRYVLSRFAWWRHMKTPFCYSDFLRLSPRKNVVGAEISVNLQCLP